MSELVKFSRYLPKSFHMRILLVLDTMLIFVIAGISIFILVNPPYGFILLVRFAVTISLLLTIGMAVRFAVMHVKVMQVTNQTIKRLQSIAETGDFSQRVDIKVTGKFDDLAFEVNNLLAAIEQKNRQLESMANLLKQKEEQEQLLWLEIEHSLCLAKEEAEMDGLTGLFNRRSIEDRLAREMGKADQCGHPLSILMADIDHFKKVNDTYGHQTGDEVLKLFAGVLKSSIRTNDVPARYGGEEFIIVLPEIKGQSSLKVAQRIKNEFAKAVEREFTPINGLKCTVSIGVADYPLCAKEKGHLIAAADEALFKAKQDGRNRVVYYKEMHELKTKTA